MDNQVHVISRDWIHKHKTKRGGFTRAQIEALGIKYPPTTGWIQKLEGSQISIESAKMFETGKSKFSSKRSMKYKKIIFSLNSLSREELDLIVEYIKQLYLK